MSSGSPKSSGGNNEDYTHQLAIKLSRALNIVNPNDLLARRVTDIAKTNSVDGFIKGIHALVPYFPISDPSSAARAFGKFKDSFLAELHAEILSHAKQEATGIAPQPIEGITVHDSDVLEPEPVRQGGLVRQESVCS
jgi:pre-mRNA-splicing factor ATP-dependent RNA helicase DHX38/PRP16